MRLQSGIKCMAVTATLAAVLNSAAWADFRSVHLGYVVPHDRAAQPLWLALGHGAVAATGVGRLIYAAVSSGISTLAQVALGIFILAALGGATLLLGFHMHSKALPIAFVLGHGLIAATGLALLLVSYVQG